MKHRTTDDFWRCYESLPPVIQTKAKQSFNRLESQPSYPGLNFKPITDKKGLWSARIDNEYRALAEKIDTMYVWDWIGTHAEYLKQIKKR